MERKVVMAFSPHTWVAFSRVMINHSRDSLLLTEILAVCHHLGQEEEKQMFPLAFPLTEIGTMWLILTCQLYTLLFLVVVEH